MRKLLYIIPFLMVMSSCTKDFESINKDPNNPTDVSTGFLFANATKQACTELTGVQFGGRQGMQYAQYWSTNQYTTESEYQERPGYNNLTWSVFYATSLEDYQNIIDLNTNSPEQAAAYGDNNNQIAMAEIMQAWIYQIATDAWGDIPFTSALKPSDTYTPTYDKQSDIYPALIGMVNDAISKIDVDKPGFTSGDVLYGGDMEAWLRFANSLKLRIAIRMSDRMPSQAATAIQEAVASGVMMSNDDNAEFHYLAAAPNNNPLNEDRKTRFDFAASEALINTLKSKSDPRIGKYAEPAQDGPNAGQFVGMPYGLTEGDAGSIPTDNVSQPSGSAALAKQETPSSGIFAPDFPYVIMSYAETEFILSEAAARGMGGVTGATGHYEAGVEASMSWWGVSDADISAYWAANPAPAISAGNYRQEIGVQKWLALYGQGNQGWFEFRRLDFKNVLIPAASPLVKLSTPTGVPVRTAYPVDEAQLNPDSYAKANDQMGMDGSAESQLGTKVWWDVN